MSWQTVALERHGPVAVLRYHNPPGNLLCARGLLELRQAFCAVDDDPSVRVIVLTGRDGYMLALDPTEGEQMSRSIPRLPRPGRRLVAAGLPLLQRVLPLLVRWLDDTRPEAVIRNGFANHLVLFDRIERSDKVTVAAIGGDCMGGGMELSLCFDLRVAADADLVLAQPEAVADLVPGFGATWRMSRLLGVSRALELQLLCDPVSPKRAAELGLVNRVLPADGFDDEVLALATRLARRSPAAVAGVKAAVRSADPSRELLAVLDVWSSPDAEEGLARFRALIDEELARPEAERRSVAQLLATMDP